MKTAAGPNSINRREALAAMTAFAMLASTASAEDDSTAATLDHSTVFHLDALKGTRNANGVETRPVVTGTLPTGEFVELHETTLPAGLMPHPPHRHANSEFVLIREGQVDYLTDGHSQPAGPGDVIYTASNAPHGMRAAGSSPAKYFIVSVGVKDKPTPVTLAPPA
jgi:quercetin dioxygenase-like cupin family protein